MTVARRSLTARCGLTVLAVSLAALARWLLSPFLQNEAPFATFIIAVIFVARFYDLRQTLLATMLGFCVVLALFMPHGTSAWAITVTSVVRCGLYFVICGAIATFAEAARSALERLKEAKELADQRAEMLRMTFASIGDAVITTDKLGNVTYLNSVCESLTGYTNEAALGLSLEKVFHVIDETTRQPVPNAGMLALEKKPIVGVGKQSILVARDHTERTIDDTAAAIFDQDHNVIGSIVIFRDVTERKQEQKKLRDALSRLESMLDSGEVGTWEFDTVQNKVYADKNLARMFGVTEEEAQGGPIERYIDAIHPLDRPDVTESIKSAVSNGSTIEAEYRIARPDNSVIWVVARGRVQRDETGRAACLPGVVVDITDRKRAEEELRASEVRRRLALDAADLGTWNIDPATNMLASDERFRLIFTGNTRELTYEEAFERLHPEDCQKVRAAVAAATDPNNTAPYEMDYRVVHPDGAIRWVFAKGRACYEFENGERRLVSFDGTVADITARKKMENDLRQLASDLSEADHRKDEFLATLAHELRNPLAPIRNGLELMRLAGTEGPRADEARMMMERQLSQLVRLVDDLMDVSRISQGKLELRTEPVSLRAVIDSAIETSRSLIDEMGHTLTVDFPQEPICVEADFTRLSQVFLNLLNNSAKYSERCSQIWVTVARVNDRIQISVKDTGIGIATDQLPRIFDLFSQIDHSLAKSQGGLGIGLSLVKQLVEMHGGSIEAKSDGAGRGAEFIVLLPVLETIKGSQGHEDSPQLTVPRGLKLLVVDDNRDSADSLALMLRVMGNETLTAYDGENCVRAASTFRPNVILLDIGLPRMNGYEACRLIRALPGGSDFFIIAQTGWGTEEDRQRTHDAGFNQHLVKPIDPEALRGILAVVPQEARNQV